MRLADAYPFYLLDECPVEDLPWIAVNDLLAGCGGDVVAQLAGMSHPTRRDVDDILPHALNELGIEPTTSEEVCREQEEAWRELARGYLDDIIFGRLTPSEGSYQLFLISRHKVFVDSDEMEDKLVSDIAMGYGAVLDDEDSTPDDQAWAAASIFRGARELRSFLD